MKKMNAHSMVCLYQFKSHATLWLPELNYLDKKSNNTNKAVPDQNVLNYLLSSTYYLLVIRVD